MSWGKITKRLISPSGTVALKNIRKLAHHVKDPIWVPVSLELLVLDDNNSLEIWFVLMPCFVVVGKVMTHL